MFGEHEPLDRIGAAKNAGFAGIEWLFPYNVPCDQIKVQLLEHEIPLVLVNTGLGNRKHNEVGIGAVPGRESAFQSEFRTTLEYVRELTIPMVHVMAGKVPPGEKSDRYVETFLTNLEWAVKESSSDNVELLIEALNQYDVPGYLHSTSAESATILSKCEERVALQFDLYHAQLMEGNLRQRIIDHFDQIKHVQFSSVPGRNEPQFGEVNIYPLLDLLEQLGYDGFVGAEYTPRGSTVQGLTWMDRYR